MEHFLSSSDLENGWFSIKTIPLASERRSFVPGIYTGNVDTFGNPIFKVILPSDEPIVDVGGLAHKLVEDMNLFIDARPKYQRLKLPHKRGYLLHGAPGNGKSSMIRLVQNLVVKQLGGIVLHITGMSCATFYGEVRKILPAVPIMLVIEDLDHYLRQGWETQFLEFLDGAVSIDNTILLATTNHLETVPDRVRSRPSRIDRLFEVLKPNDEERGTYLVALGAGPEVKTLVNYSKGMSFAQAKELFIASQLYGTGIEEVAERLKGLPSESFADDEDDEDEGKMSALSSSFVIAPNEVKPKRARNTNGKLRKSK